MSGVHVLLESGRSDLDLNPCFVFPGDSDGKESPCKAGDPALIPGSGRSPGEGNDYPVQYSCLENSMNRSLADYSSWGHKELDMTERLSTHATLDPFFI